MNSIFGMFMGSWILQVSCKVNVKPFSPKAFTLTLQETRSIHDPMNIPKIEFIAYIYIFFYKFLKYKNYF